MILWKRQSLKSKIIRNLKSKRKFFSKKKLKKNLLLASHEKERDQER